MEYNLGIEDKTVLINTKRSSFKKSSVLFAGKIPFITSLIRESVDQGVIKKIYLFGSYAYGEPNEDSDIDLCVIISNRRNDTKAYLKIALALFDHKIMPVDLLVYKEKNFIIGIKKNEQGVESVINAKGKVLYDYAR
jgi:predicted nucleotidyltransferase